MYWNKHCVVQFAINTQNYFFFDQSSSKKKLLQKKRQKEIWL